MMDYKRWIYSQDIAEWLTGKKPLSLAEQLDCICSAPHRTFAEKLEGLRELKHYHNEKEVRDKIWQIEESSKHFFRIIDIAIFV